MAGTGKKTTSAIYSTASALYGWDSIYDPTVSGSSYIVQSSSKQGAIYGSPWWYEQLNATGGQNIYVGGYYAPSTITTSTSTKGTSTYAPVAYEADYVNGGTGSTWISFKSFGTIPGFDGTKNGYDGFAAGGWPQLTAGNVYRDLGTARHSLIAGDGIADSTDGTPGVVVNLSSKSIKDALSPLVRVETPKTTPGSVTTITNYGLINGLSDYLLTRLTGLGNLPTDLSAGDLALDGKDSGRTGSVVSLFDTGGLGPSEYAFYTRETPDTDQTGNKIGKYAIGRMTSITNVQGSSDASNVIVAGAASGYLQGGSKDDIIVGGSGNNVFYGMGGHDLLISTVGNDTMYAGQVGHRGTTTPANAIVADTAMIRGTTMIAGTGVVTMVGSDTGNDYFIVGKANNTIYGSGLGASGLGDEGTSINAGDYDTLSFAQIGATYFTGFNDLTITINFSDSGHQSGTAVGTYRKMDGSYATLFNDKFFDIEHIVFGSTNVIFKDPANPNGYYPTDPIDPGYTGGTPGSVNPNTGLIDPGPATSTVTGNNPSGGNTVQGGGGGNTNFNGGGGPAPNTLNFSSTSGVTHYDCEDQLGKTGNVRNFSLVLDLIGEKYSYQQDINGTPTVYGGTVTNFQTVTGTVDCSDILVGKSDTISLTGGGGIHNILYAGGGTFTDNTGTHATTLTGSHQTTSANGGAGYNWVVFQNPTELINAGNGNVGGGRSGVSYASGVNANLDPEYTFTDDFQHQRTGAMIGFANILGTAGEDTLTGDANDNVLVGGGGNDTIAGGAEHESNWGGNDTIYGGSGINRITGGALVDDTDTFVVGYDYNPVAAGSYAKDGSYGPITPTKTENGNTTGDILAGDVNSNLNSTVLNNVGIVTTTSAAARDYISDWKNTDHLYVSTKGTAIVEGLNESDALTHSIFTLATQTSTAGREVDFRGAQNLGQIRVTIGDGNNTVYGSTTAYRDNGVSNGGSDYIKVGNGSNTIDSGNGNDIIVTGSGRNTITVGEGVGKKIYTGGGYNTVNLGAGDDTVYISRLTTKDDIHNFVSGTDKIFLDRAMLNTVGITDLVQRQIDPIANSGYQAVIEGPQDYKAGVFIGAPLFNAVYRSTIASRGPSNGANDNTDHYNGYVAGISAEVGLQIGLFATGYALYGIPFVGPILGAVFVGLGLGVIADQATARQHLNPTYNTDPLNTAPGEDGELVSIGGKDYQVDNPIIGLSNVMKTNATPGTALGTSWAGTPFMSFYNYSTAGGFVPSLEVIWNKQQGSGGINKTWSKQDRFSTKVKDSPDPVLANGVEGIHTVALLHSGGQTFIYLINSPDALIQSNEAKLIARVDGLVRASDLDLFDAATDENLAGGMFTFDPPPSITALSYATTDAGKTITGVSDELARTNASSATVTVTFAANLRAGDVVRLIDPDGVILDTKTGTGPSVVFNLSSLAQGGNGYSVTVTSADGLDKSISFSVVVDSVAPQNTAASGTEGTEDYVAAQNPVGVTASTVGIVVSANEAASFALYDNKATPAIVVLDTNPATKTATTNLIPLDSTSLSATVVPAAQGAVTWLESVRFKDLAGNESTVGLGLQPDEITQLPYIGLGTISDDIFAVSYATNTVVYGFGGEDAVTAKNSSSTLTTFIGGDNNATSLNVITANTNGGNLLIDLTKSDTKVDTIKIGDGKAGVQPASGGFDAAIGMQIAGFTASADKLIFVDDGISGSPSTSVFADATAGVTNGILTGMGSPASLDALIDDVEAFLVSENAAEGSVLAARYQYTVLVNQYDSSGNKLTPLTTLYDDLILFHVDGSGQYSVVQLVGLGTASGLSVVSGSVFVTVLGSSA